MRGFLAAVAEIREDDTVVDICTGTGSSALRMARDGIRIVGIDLSEGMLRQARAKSIVGSRPHWVQADAGFLPVLSSVADRVTCSYAMYELSGKTRRKVLQEAARILKPGGMFLMMEHLPPKRICVRFLYQVRICLFGSREVRAFAGSEEAELSRFFVKVRTVIGPGSRTKAVLGYKPCG